MTTIFKQKNEEFTSVYTKHYAVVFSTLYSRLGDAHAAEDLAQEVFIRFYAKMEVAVNIRGWILITMKNVLYEHYRKSKNMPDDIAYAEAFDDVSLTFVNGFRDTRIIIEKAVENLDENPDRIIFDMVAVQNYTYEEAGKLIGLTKRQIKYRYNIIVKTVLEHLQKQGINSIEDLL